MKHVELLAPAGNLEKLKYAIAYGADAVYLGIPDFSLRVRINQFDEKTLIEGVEYAHQSGKKAYVTLNIYAHNRHIPAIEKHLKFLKKLNVDGIIVSDPGIINMAKKYLPKVDIHLSTQANTTNWQAVKFWRDLGIKRIILAREVTLLEIKEIRKKVPDIELEYFVHGAMCMSYSGRCILSKWMTGRSANLGDCSQPCRWAYRQVSAKGGSASGGKSPKFKVKRKEDKFFDISVIDDQKRYGMDVEEDGHGTYFFNSYDMNLIEHVEDLIKAGVTSLKIEGRAKSAYYVAVVTRAYRKVIGAVETDCNLSLRRKIIVEQKKELGKLAHRGYSTGFLLGSEPSHNFENENNKSEWKFVGEVRGTKNGLTVVRVHNEIFLDNRLQALTPLGNSSVKIKRILDHNMKETEEAHGGHSHEYYFDLDKRLSPDTLLRKSLLNK